MFEAKAFTGRDFMLNELFLLFLTKRFSCKVLCFVLLRGKKRPHEVFLCSIFSVCKGTAQNQFHVIITVQAFLFSLLQYVPERRHGYARKLARLPGQGIRTALQSFHHNTNHTCPFHSPYKLGKTPDRPTL